MEITKYTVPIGDSRTPTQFDIRDSDSVNRISDLKAYIGYTDTDILGLEVDFENKVFTRLAGAIGKTVGTDFNTFSMYGGRKICNLANNGTVNAWLGDNNYAEDGSNGQVMLYQPKFYYKVVPLKIEPIIHDYYDVAQEKDITVQGDGWQVKKVRYYICAEPRVGFKIHPAFLDENGNEVEGIYTGVYPGSIYDSSESKYLKYDTWNVTEDGDTRTINSYDGFTLDTSSDMLSSIAGVKPASGEFAKCPLTRINFEAVAKNRGTGWHIETSKVQMMENLLMMIEFAGMNMQTAIENGVVSYASGTHNESVYTGSTAALGQGTGHAASTSRLITGATADSTDSRASYRSIRYRGKEDIWGDIWEFNCDILMHGNGSQKDGGGHPCICNDFAYTDSVTATSAIPANYNEVPFTAMSQSGYISAIGYDKDYDWLFIGTERKGNATLPIGDYTYVSNTTQNIAPAGETAINKVVSGMKGFRVACRGGGWRHGGYAGPFCWLLNDGVGYRIRHFGARLFYVPQN